MQAFRMNEPDQCVLNVTPEDMVALEEDGCYRSINFAMSERSLLVPGFDSSKAHVLSVKVPAPPLKHLCRLVVRNLIPHSTQLHRLQLPSKLANYLAYNTWV